MNMYRIIKGESEGIFGVITAVNAGAALRDWAETQSDSPFGFICKIVEIDAETHGDKWAVADTDGGLIMAEIVVLNVVSRRYYPSYYGRVNTRYSFRSWYIGGEPVKGSADFIVGKVSGLSEGWVLGSKGNPARSLPDFVRNKLFN